MSGSTSAITPIELSASGDPVGELEMDQEKLTQREKELSAIIMAYNEVTDQLKATHEKLRGEVFRLREELARKNKQLQRRERLAALGEMAAGVAHEIRNPLGGIQLYASLLGKDVRDQPGALRLVEKIATGIGKLESLVTEVLEFGRPSEPTPGRVVINELIRETVELAQARSNGYQAGIEIVGSCDGLEMITDGGLLQRALLNLLLNAVEAASGDDGRVELAVGPTAGGQIGVVVSDNGPGIPSEILDRIFNPFFTTRDHGTGLGLAIVHQIAETLGGSVQAANRSKCGAEFTLTLPQRLPDKE